MKHIKTVCAFLLPAFLLSCASAPLPQEESNLLQEEEQQEETEEQTMPQEPEHAMEEPPADSGNPLPEPEAVQDTEIIYEPVEDIEGYYESDPEPVFLEPAPAQPDEEQQEDIPAADAAPEMQEETQPQEAEPAPQTQTEPLDGESLPQDESAPEAPSVPEPPAQEPQEETAEPESLGENTEPVPPAPEPVPEPPAESAEPLPQEPEAERQSEAAVPSRSVLIKNSQYLDVAYPGKGWIYLGEENGKQLMRYFGRKIGEQNTLFSLRSKEEGSTVLHFYKSDPLTGTFIDDYLAVTIQGKSTDQQRAAAPDYAEIVPPRLEKEASPAPEAARKPEAEKNVPAAVQEPPQENQAAVPQAAQKEDVLPPQSGTQLSSPDAGQPSLDRVTSAGDKSGSLKKAESGQDLQADELLKKARAHLESRQYKEALSCLEEFFEKATSRIDEGLYLQGQVFESNSSVRNIRSALDTYETIVRRYPQSAYWTQANNRAIYLKKFYFNIR